MVGIPAQCKNKNKCRNRPASFTHYSNDHCHPLRSGGHSSTLEINTCAISKD